MSAPDRDFRARIQRLIDHHSMVAEEERIHSADNRFHASQRAVHEARACRDELFVKKLRDVLADCDTSREPPTASVALPTFHLRQRVRIKKNDTKMHPDWVGKTGFITSLHTSSTGDHARIEFGKEASNGGGTSWNLTELEPCASEAPLDDHSPDCDIKHIDPAIGRPTKPCNCNHLERMAVALHGENHRPRTNEATICTAKHRVRPDAKCSLLAGHERNHEWTGSQGCSHPFLHRTPPECTACGTIVYEQRTNEACPHCFVVDGSHHPQCEAVRR